MDAVNITLEDWQAGMLRQLLDRAVDAHARGRPGAVFAQLVECTDGSVVAQVRFVDREACDKIQEATGKQGMVARDIKAFGPPERSGSSENEEK